MRLGGAAYRGLLEFRPGGSGVNVVNAVSLEDYVAGVVARESPSSWPAEALKAQAVAARTYAITTSKAGAGFEHYADVRSQVYGGIAAETASTNAAVTATRGQVVTYDGRPVVTFFFSTSGGRTENVENTNVGAGPQPWLKSVADPYDNVSPKHRWRPARLSLSAAGAKLAGLVKGRFRGIEVLERGRSPRIVAADVVGTGGRTRVDGATLRARLGLLDTWAYFTTIRSRKAPAVATASGPGARATVAGSVVPARVGAQVQIQLREGRRWETVASTIVRRGGTVPGRRGSGRRVPRGLRGRGRARHPRPLAVAAARRSWSTPVAAEARECYLIGTLINCIVTCRPTSSAARSPRSPIRRAARSSVASPRARRL